MKYTVALILVLGLLCSGCSYWMNGSYSSVVPHTEPTSPVTTHESSMANYFQTKSGLTAMIMNGSQSAVFTLLYDSLQDAQRDIQNAIDEVCSTNPYAVYAVQNIRYELGTSNGQNAVRIHINYLQNKVDVKTISSAKNMEEVKELIAKNLDDCSAGVVFYCESWGQKDYAQIVTDYAMKNAHIVIEQPEVTVNLYPEKGTQQIIELKFSYQTSRDSLRTMQSHVAVVLNSAQSSVDTGAPKAEQSIQLCRFLMNRYPTYEIRTSITPAYSLLRHGVGDEKAFAMVYTAMCQENGIPCDVVTGTRDGEPWTWNVIKLDGVYYHIDLLRGYEQGDFTLCTGGEMDGYVWDYSRYPV